MLRIAIITLMAVMFPAFCGNTKIDIRVGESKVLTFAEVSKVSIADPTVADIMSISDREIFILGKNMGKTALYIWSGGKMFTFDLSVTSNTLESKIKEAIGKELDVIVAKDMIILKGIVESEDEKKIAEQIAKAYSEKITNLIRIAPEKKQKVGEFMNQEQEIEELINIPGVKVKVRESKLVLDGNVKNQVEYQRASKVASIYSENVINLLNVKQPYQIMIEGKIIDISRRSTESLGVDWGSDITSAHLSTGAGKGSFSFTEFRDASLTADDNLKVGSIVRYYNVMGVLKSLVEDGKARIVSSPTLVSMSGVSSVLEVGGEVPVRKTDVSEKAVTESFEYKKYGLNVLVTPEVTHDSKVRMDMDIVITDVSYGNTRDQNQNVVPEFLSRSARSSVTCLDGDTIVISGLAREQNDVNNDSIPMLSKIPGLGKLFNNRVTKKQESELLILLTPHIVYADSVVSEVIHSPVSEKQMAPEEKKVVEAVKVPDVKKTCTEAEIKQTTAEKAVVCEAEKVQTEQKNTVSEKVMEKECDLVKEAFSGIENKNASQRRDAILKAFSSI